MIRKSSKKCSLFFSVITNQNLNEFVLFFFLLLYHLKHKHARLGENRRSIMESAKAKLIIRTLDYVFFHLFSIRFITAQIMYQAKIGRFRFMWKRWFTFENYCFFFLSLSFAAFIVQVYEFQIDLSNEWNDEKKNNTYQIY